MLPTHNQPKPGDRVALFHPESGKLLVRGTLLDVVSEHIGKVKFDKFFDSPQNCLFQNLRVQSRSSLSKSVGTIGTLDKSRIFLNPKRSV